MKKNMNARILFTASIIFFLSYSTSIFSKTNIEEIKLLLKNGKYDKAENLVNMSINNNFNDPELLFYKGIIETNLNKNNQAIDTFRDITERFPQLPEPFNNLAVLYAGKGQYRLAKEILEQAIKTNPSYLTAHINLGDIFTKMASEAYNKALEIDKSNNIAITKLSMITQLFNYQPNTRNSEIESIVAKKEKPKKLSKEELSIEIKKIIKNWKVSWENKDMQGYLNSYASNFNYPNNMNKVEWEKYRTNRIVSKKTINILISNINLIFKKEKITATFVQNYKSGKLNQISNKTLVFIKEKGQWLIFKETSGQ